MAPASGAALQASGISDLPAETASAEIALRLVENQSILGGQPMFDKRLSPAMKPIYILSDHHSDYEAVFSTLKERGIRDATVIHVGDGRVMLPNFKLIRDYTTLHLITAVYLFPGYPSLWRTIIST